MTEGLRTLMADAIDYAGLFPPAQLPLGPALANYDAYRACPDAWMLGRFVCPAARLSELDAARPLCIVGRGGGATMKEIVSNSRDDWNDIQAFGQRFPQAPPFVYEVRLGNDALRPEHGDELRTLIRGAAEMLANDRLRPAAQFFEIEYGSSWQATLGYLIGALLEDPQRRKGLKIRCGGATAAAVPTTADVAFGLAACRVAGVPVKFTAGLHHPLRHPDTALGVPAHGFINVFAAGVLGHAHKLDAKQVQSIVEDEDASHFGFDDNGLSWNDLHATTAEIAVARKAAVVSFGSCSFDEPRDDLRSLGWL